MICKVDSKILPLYFVSFQHTTRVIFFLFKVLDETWPLIHVLAALGGKCEKEVCNNQFREK